MDKSKGFIIGHEAMGIVEEVGKEVNKVKKGDKIIVPFPIACGGCWYCQHDLWSQCDNSNDHGEMGGIFGYSDVMVGYDGGQAEYLRVPYANVGPRITPEGLTDEQVLFLTDILPTSYWGVENAGVKSGDTVVVLGCGQVGLLAQKWAIFMGAKRVIAVDRVDYRLNHAKKFNGVETINFENFDNTGEYIKELTSGGSDSVIDCVGMDGKMSTIEKVETALKLQGGSKSAIEMGQCPAHTYVDRILKLIKEEKFDATDIITHILPLDQGKHAYEIFDEKQDNCIKVILNS